MRFFPPLASAYSIIKVSIPYVNFMSLSEAVEKIKHETHRLARRQCAWFRLDDARIRWLAALSWSKADTSGLKLFFQNTGIPALSAAETISFTHDSGG